MDIERLQKEIDELKELFYKHKHLEYDRTKALDSTTGYSGKVDSGGTTGTLPTGWTVAHNGTGDYTVTHGLGQTLFPSVGAAGVVGFVQVIATGTTTFQVSTYNSSVAATDMAWYFNVII